ncbi:hypothetical protein PBI_SCTP2_52 [Salicola phage SCTP-2]|nr:hypothetical protein PBI_SCTP2_52 [Salicola phage SCTP-2]
MYNDPITNIGSIMLTIYDFFEKFRTDQIRLLSECHEFNVIQLYAMYDNLFKVLSDLTAVGIPNNVSTDDPELFSDGPMCSKEFGIYLQNKIDEMDDDCVIYFVNNLFKFDLDGEPYAVNDSKRSNNLSHVDSLKPLIDDEKSSFWMKSWLQTEFMNTKYVHEQYIDFIKCADISESLIDRFTNDFSVTMIIPIDHLHDNPKELFELLSKKNTELRITYCTLDYEFKNRTSIFRDFSCERFYNNDHYKTYKTLENIKYYEMIDNIVRCYKFAKGYYIGKHYITVECEFESLLEGYLSKFCNYLKVFSDPYQGYIYMSNFRINTMYNDVQTRKKVIQMYDCIAKLK